MRERLDPEASAAAMAEYRRELRADYRATLKHCAGSGRAPFTDESTGERTDGKGECEVCGGVFTLRKDGTVRTHDERLGIDPDWRGKELARRAARWHRAAMKLSGADNETDYYESEVPR